MERQGIPAATIITTVFANTARAYTRLMGVPNFPYLMCAHPIGRATSEELQSRARLLTPAVRHLLINGELAGSPPA